MNFAVSMIWRGPTDLITDCYFCLTPSVLAITMQKRKLVVYPSLSSAVRPVPHTINFPVPKCPQNAGSVSGDWSKVENMSVVNVADSETSYSTSKAQHVISITSRTERLDQGFGFK